MLSSYILALREGLEAALIIGIVLSMLRKMEQQNLNLTVWLGVISAIFVSIAAALGLNWIGAEFEGKGEQLFEGITMFLAAGILTWMIFWMQKQSKSMNQKIESEVRQAIGVRGKRALFLLTFFAVVREGIELALFLLAARFISNPFQQILGAALGLGTAAILGWIIYTSSTRLNLKKFFTVTNVLLLIFAAGLIGSGIHEFNELGWIPSIVEPVWNINRLLPIESTLGQLLKAMVGYSSSPSLSQVIAYIGYFVVIGLMFMIRRQKMMFKNSYQVVTKLRK